MKLAGRASACRSSFCRRQDRPDLAFLRRLGFTGSHAQVNEAAWKAAPALAGAAWSASSMWAANAATVTPSADSGDGRLHLSAANLVTNLHRSLEHVQTTASLRRIFPNAGRFAVHDALPAQPHFGDEGAANHVRLCAAHGESGVNLFVYGRGAYEPWPHRFPARQTLEASQAIVRRHGAHRCGVPAPEPRGHRRRRLPQRRGVRRDAKTCLFYHQAGVRGSRGHAGAGARRR